MRRSLQTAVTDEHLGAHARGELPREQWTMPGTYLGLHVASRLV